MAITDINISEELQTNAPSIKYRGNEGPKSPQEMAEFEMQEYIIEFERVFPEMKNRRGTPEYMEMLEDYFRSLAGGQPLPEDPTKPVNPFQPKPIGPLPDKRQMAAYGGIMGVDGRRRYGIGSKLKKLTRKLIPNEIADIAVKAAPFVAPFNPLAAGLMSGIGGFDQHGSISKGLKSGLMNYGLGNVARWAGGAGPQWGLRNPSGTGFMDTYLSSPLGKETGIGKWLDSRKVAKAPTDKVIPTSQGDYDIYGKKITEAGSGGVKSLTEKIASYALDPKILFGLAGGSIGAAALMQDYAPDQIQDMYRGEGLDIQGIRTEVIEAMKDTSGEKLKALRVKYPFLGLQSTKDVANMADGGRIGFAGGKLATFLADKTITGSSRRFLEKVFGKETFERMIENDPDLHKGLLEVVEMFRNRDKEGLKMYMQKFLPHMDDVEVEQFIIGSRPDIEGIGGQLLRLGSGRDYAGKIDMIKKADNMRKLDELDVDKLKPNANGGRISKQEGGLMDLGGMEKDYRNTGGFVDLGAKEKADDVPARLSVNEFVFTADAVRNAGGGDVDKGAEIMENMMKHLEAGGQVSEESQGLAGAQQMFEVSERLSEVV